MVKMEWWCVGAAVVLATSCRSIQPLHGHSAGELRSCRGWITEELPDRRVPRIHGQVRDRAAYPVPGVLLVLSSLPPDDTPMFVETTQENGEFAFGHVRAGRYVLKTCFPGFDTFEVPIEVDPRASDSPIEFAINPSA